MDQGLQQPAVEEDHHGAGAYQGSHQGSRRPEQTVHHRAEQQDHARGHQRPDDRRDQEQAEAGELDVHRFQAQPHRAHARGHHQGTDQRPEAGDPWLDAVAEQLTAQHEEQARQGQPDAQRCAPQHRVRQLGQAQPCQGHRPAHPVREPLQEPAQHCHEEQHRDEPERPPRWGLVRTAVPAGLQQTGQLLRGVQGPEPGGDAHQHGPEQVGDAQCGPPVADLRGEAASCGPEVAGQEEEQRHPPDLQELGSLDPGSVGVTQDHGGDGEHTKDVHAGVAQPGWTSCVLKLCFGGGDGGSVVPEGQWLWCCTAV